MKGEYETIREAGAEMVAVSSGSVESHQRFCQTLGGCPFPLVSDQNLEAARQYGVLGEDGHRSQRAVIVIDRGGILLHQTCSELVEPIPWFQPGNVGQFMGIFRALGAI